jgi:hypothetical protein
VGRMMLQSGWRDVNIVLSGRCRRIGNLHSANGPSFISYPRSAWERLLTTLLCTSGTADLDNDRSKREAGT